MGLQANGARAQNMVAKAKQNLADTEPVTFRDLNAQETAFVNAYACPPWPTITEAAEEAGYNPSYARVVARKPHIIKAIQERLADQRQHRQHDVERLMAVLLRRALTDDSRAEKNAELFLEAAGVFGKGAVNVTTTVVSQQQGTLSERIESLRKNRFALAESD